MVYSLRVFHCVGTRPSTRFPLLSIQLWLSKNGKTAPETGK
jgi:hypothetical protein